MLRKLLLFCLLLLLVIPAAAFAQDDEIELPEEYTSEDGTIFVGLPEGWAAEGFSMGESSILYLASSPELLLALVEDEDAMVSGDSYMFAVPITSFSENFGTGGDDPAEEFAAVLAEIQGDADPAEGATVGEVEEVELAEKTVYRSYISDNETEGAAYLLDFDGRFMLAVVITPPGEFEAIEPTYLAIIDSLVIVGPIIEGEETFASASGQTTFTMPGEWVVLEAIDFGFSVTNYMPESFSSDLEEGQMYMNMVEPQGLEAWGVREYNTPQDAFDQLIASLSQGMDYTSTGEPTEVAYGENTFQQVAFEGENEEGFFGLLIVDEQPFVVYVRYATGEAAEYEEGIAQILESLEFTPSEAAE